MRGKVGYTGSVNITSQKKRGQDIHWLPLCTPDIVFQSEREPELEHTGQKEKQRSNELISVVNVWSRQKSQTKGINMMKQEVEGDESSMSNSREEG